MVLIQSEGMEFPKRVTTIQGGHDLTSPDLSLSPGLPFPSLPLPSSPSPLPPFPSLPFPFPSLPSFPLPLARFSALFSLLSFSPPLAPFLCSFHSGPFHSALLSLASWLSSPSPSPRPHLTSPDLSLSCLPIGCILNVEQGTCTYISCVGTKDCARGCSRIGRSRQWIQ